jgi:hypothetical protein
MMTGAAIAHNFGLAGAADSVNEAGEYIVGGIKTNGQVAVFIALAVLLGGCPLRQLILAGSGNGDSAVTVFGMMTGAAIAHNFGLAGAAASADAAGGVGIKGRIAIIIGFVVFAAISVLNIQKQED